MILHIVHKESGLHFSSLEGAKKFHEDRWKYNLSQEGLSNDSRRVRQGYKGGRVCVGVMIGLEMAYYGWELVLEEEDCELENE